VYKLHIAYTYTKILFIRISHHLLISLIISNNQLNLVAASYYIDNPKLYMPAMANAMFLHLFGCTGVIYLSFTSITLDLKSSIIPP